MVANLIPVVGSLSLALSLLSASSFGYAQSIRQWVDPPVESVTDLSGPVSTPERPDVVPSAPDSGAVTVKETDKKISQSAVEPQIPAQPKQTTKDAPRKAAAADRNKRKLTREAATVWSGRQHPRPPRRDLIKPFSGGAYAVRNRKGTETGLELMTLRTIEFPDGRRVQVLMHSKPEVISELDDRLE